MDSDNKRKSFDIEDPVANPFVFVPEDGMINLTNQPMPPPKAEYQLKAEMEGEKPWVTSNWNFFRQNA